MQSMQISDAPQSPAIETDALLRYGFSIIPLWSRAKHPLLDSWIPYQRRKPTAAELRDWREKWPDANYGIVTGEISGICVFDIDDPDKARAWIDENGGLPRTPCVRTAKGEHYYFRHPGRTLKNGTRIASMCDFRGDGGYVVAPGSIHDTGVLYEWIVSPDESPYAELPAWIEAALLRDKPKPQRLEIKHIKPVSFGTSKYGYAALVSECETVRSTPEGGRNDQLNRSAFSIGRLIAGGEIQRSEAEAALLDAARACGLSDSEARKTLQSGIDNGMKNPRTAPEATYTPTPTNGGNKEQSVLLYKFTDTGNAERFAARYAGKVLYDYTAKGWLVWDGKRWTLDNSGTVQRYAKETARAIDDELRYVTDDMRDPLRKHATYSESEAGRRKMLECAQSELPTNQGELDSHPWLLNLDNGTLNLDTFEFGPHKPEHKITKISPVRYDDTAKAPIWIAFLNRIFEGDADLIFFVKQLCGYALTASTQEQCFFLFHGIGANGKSTLLNTMLHIAGDYGQESDFSTFMLSDAKKWELADFKGVRMLSASEGERGQRLAESLVKQLTGGEKLKAEKKYGNPFRFKPELKLILSTNHKPRVNGTDYAIWRRVRFVPFNVVIPPEEQDPTLTDKLKSEDSGILNWAIEGLQAWQEKRLIEPDAVKAATAAYRDEQDSLALFIEECCVTGAVYAELSTLYELYDQWATQSGEHATAKRAFSERLTERGFTKDRGKANAVIFRGIGVKSESNLSNP